MRAAVTRKPRRADSERARTDAISRRAAASVASYVLGLPLKDRLVAMRAISRMISQQMAMGEVAVSTASFLSAEAYRLCPVAPEKIQAETEADRVFGKTVEAANG